jgi:hypothetical protein
MRPLMIATTALALIGAGTAFPALAGDTPQARWAGGAQAPGGWAAYRRPAPGYALPVYWQAPRFTVADWRTRGLPQPPAGLRWSRYYDDAVLVDRHGSIRQVIPGLAWEGRADPYYVLDDNVYAGPLDRGGIDAASRVADRELASDPRELASDDPPIAPERAPPPPAGWAAPHPGWAPPHSGWAPPHPGSAPPHPGSAPPPPPRSTAWTSPDGRTVVTIETGPSVTTTTETYEDVVTYADQPVRKAIRKRVWKPRTKLRCNCSS